MGGTLNFYTEPLSPLAYEVVVQHLKLRTTHFKHFLHFCIKVEKREKGTKINYNGYLSRGLVGMGKGVGGAGKWTFLAAPCLVVLTLESWVLHSYKIKLNLNDF